MSEPRGRLLIVDDEAELTQALCESLNERGYAAIGATSGPEGLKLLEKQHFDLLLCDLMMPGMDGLQVLKAALELDPGLVGIIMTGQGSIPTAVEAMRLGAFDYVLKPFELRNLLPILERALETRRLRTENVRLRHYVERLTFESPRYRLIGSSPAMKRVMQLIEKVAPTDATVLIRGASGTGKELAARAIHFNSPRRNKPLVTINCAALQETLLESELFGHEKGAFTGAVHAKPGLFEVAEGGTLFIDEVAEMSPAVQAKLLRVLEDGHFRRVGGIREYRADARILVATNKPLEEEQKAGRFREDLFYRLNVVCIEMPPLRERREDIPELVEHFLSSRQIGPVRFRIHPDAMQALLKYDWPGNVRELANVLERAQILAENHLITLNDLPEAVRSPGCRSGIGDASQTFDLAELERRTVAAALAHARGNKLQAARLLGVSRRALYRLIAKYGLENAASPERSAGS
ncbi:MAG: sigma-54 dependent transcriptional regulator [Gemmatales bacterium]|nr:sigma-54 dependent transcriptional regulator [Gemmatales bacterium]MDW8385894.1 sigma-54 dependent transcriptional regulator [Gemmatales bacterium]